MGKLDELERTARAASALLEEASPDEDGDVDWTDSEIDIWNAYMRAAAPAIVLSLVVQGRKAADALWRAREVLNTHAANHPLVDEIDALFEVSPPDPPADKPLTWAEKLHGIDGL